MRRSPAPGRSMFVSMGSSMATTDVPAARVPMIHAMSTPNISRRAVRGDSIRGSRVGRSYSGGLGESARRRPAVLVTPKACSPWGSDPPVGQRGVHVAGLRDVGGLDVGLDDVIAVTSLAHDRAPRVDHQGMTGVAVATLGGGRDRDGVLDGAGGEQRPPMVQ